MPRPRVDRNTTLLVQFDLQTEFDFSNRELIEAFKTGLQDLLQENKLCGMNIIKHVEQFGWDNPNTKDSQT